MRSKPADKSRKSILRSDPFESPYDMVDDSYHQLPGQGDVTVSKSVVSPKEDLHKKTRSRSFSVGPNEKEGNIRKLFTRRKSAGVPFSISNPNFNSSDDSENEEGRNLEKKKVKSRRSSLTKQSNESNSRRGSAQVSSLMVDYMHCKYCFLPGKLCDCTNPKLSFFLNLTYRH